jgi:hypothetical protein
VGVTEAFNDVVARIIDAPCCGMRMRISTSHQEGPPPPPTPPPLVDRAVIQPRACRGISICRRCRTMTRRQVVCIRAVGFFSLSFPSLRAGTTSARPQTCTSHHYSDHIHDFTPCIILSSRCATFIIRDCFRAVTRSRASHPHVFYTCLGLGNPLPSSHRILMASSIGHTSYAGSKTNSLK